MEKSDLEHCQVTLGAKFNYSKKTIIDLFVQQVQLTPESIAVHFSNTKIDCQKIDSRKIDYQKITYRQLNDKVNQVAQILQQYNLPAGTHIGLALSRSVELLITMLALIKLRLVFVALDPEYPAKRIAYMIKQGEIKALLAEPQTIEAWSAWQEFSGLNLKCLNSVEIVQNALTQSTSEPANFPQLSDPLYVLYTSGSTGLPKGVEMWHEPISQLIQWQIAEHQHYGSLRTLQFTSMNFDVSIQEIFSSLCSGSSLVLLNDSERRDAEKLLQILVQQKVERLFLPYVALQQLATQASTSAIQPNTLKVVITAGEKLIITKAIRHWFQSLQHTDLINQYGPTETHVVVTQHILPAAEVNNWPNIPPIGKPLANVQCLVLDEQNKPVTSGNIGQFYVGGHNNLAKGYWQNNKLTEQVFIQLQSGQRYYATGDLVSVDAQKNILYHGRVDQQVKIRGHRVELGEIESCLQSINQVNLAAVVAVADKSGAQHLCAYVTLTKNDVKSSDNIIIELADIRHSITQRLPEFMVPQKILPMDHLPVTPSGKTDRLALQQLTFKSQTKEQYDWRDTFSELIADIWQDTLSLSHTHPEQDFFNLGGHSLLATQLLVQIEKQTRLRVSLAELLARSRLGELIHCLLQKKTVSTNQSDKIGFDLGAFTVTADPDNRYQPFPLTDVQQAYWLGRNPVFELGNISTHIYLEIDATDLNVSCCEIAWNMLIQRHDMLRATVSNNGEQQVAAEVPYYQFIRHNFHGMNEQSLDHAQAGLRNNLSHKIHEPHRWPLFDIQVSEHANISRLHIGLDILIVDAQSQYAIAAQWFALYQSLLKGESQQHLKESWQQPKLKPQLTFRDYLIAEQTFKSLSQDASWNYWNQRIDNLPASPRLPLACAPAAIKHPKFTRRSGCLPAEQWKQLQNKSRELGLTPSVVLLTLFSEVLQSWSSSSHFTLNLTLFNRLPVHKDIEQLVGDFTSVTLLQIDASERQFINLAKQIQTRLWQDLDHRFVSGIEVLRELNHRSTGDEIINMPIVFTSALGLANTAEISQGFQQFGKQPYGISQTSQTWLDHQVMEQNGELIFLWDAIEALFPDGMLDAMFAMFCDRLSQFAENQSTWTELRKPRLLPSIQTQSRQSYNDTVVDYPVSTLHAAFIEQARLTPQNTAVMCEQRSITYLELLTASQSLAKQLQQQGLIAGEKVIIHLYKSWQQVVAVMGTLMAGGVYVPVDSQIPKLRLNNILQQTQSGFVITDSSDADKIFPEKLTTININNNWLNVSFDHGLISQDIINPDLINHNDPQQLAYIIFTSGSTGVPKGVALTHASVMNTINDINRRICIQPEDRVFALSSLSFDLSVYDIFGVLAAGSALVMPSEQDYKDPVRWVTLMQQFKVSIWNSVPTLFQMLTEYLSANQPVIPTDLRLAMLSGDWLPVSLPEQATGFWPHIKLLSLGGATEAAIWSIYYEIDQIDPNWPSIPYGKPLGNQQMWVLDENYADCPEWVTGEIHIGGLGLAQSYFADEKKTAESFVAHPVTGERLYKTGDLGCFMPSGDIRFLGRVDNQVKVSGHRIELDEIDRVIQLTEEVVRSHIQIINCGKKKLLAAFIQLKDATVDENTFIEQLLQFSRQYLPDYMLPTHIELLTSWPLTNNGKIDRNALEQQVSLKQDFAKNNIANVALTPGNHIATNIVKIWCDLLNRESVSTSDNFFSVGGDSLLATRLYNRLMHEFPQCSQLTVIHLFQCPTVSTQEKLIKENLIQEKLVRNKTSDVGGSKATGSISRGEKRRMGVKNFRRRQNRQEKAITTD